MNDEINNLCKKIAAESDPEKLRQLASRLQFVISEYSLRMQNVAIFTSCQVQEHSKN